MCHPYCTPTCKNIRRMHSWRGSSQANDDCGEFPACRFNKPPGQATPGSALGGWRARAGGNAHTRMASRESIFYDDDAEPKATPLSKAGRCASMSYEQGLCFCCGSYISRRGAKYNLVILEYQQSAFLQHSKMALSPFPGQ